MRNIVIATGVAVVAITTAGYFSLNNGALRSPRVQAPAAAVVPFSEIAKGTRSTVDARANYLITSSAELDRLWAMTDAKGKPPAVDFALSTVIAAFAGKEPSGGYGISIRKVEDASVRTVVVALSSPGAGCVSSQVITAPYIIVQVPKTSLPFAHEYVTTTTACR